MSDTPDGGAGKFDIAAKLDDFANKRSSEFEGFGNRGADEVKAAIIAEFDRLTAEVSMLQREVVREARLFYDLERKLAEHAVYRLENQKLDQAARKPTSGGGGT